MSLKVYKNKLLLSLLSLLLVLQLVFSALFVPRVEAAVPLAAPLAAALGSFVLDTAIDMGIRFVDNKAKTDFKDKAVGDIWAKYGDEIKDLKPTKKNAGKWLLEVPKWLTGVAIDYIADKAFEVAQGDVNRRKSNDDAFIPSSIDYEVGDPFYNTSVAVDILPAVNNGSFFDNSRYLAYLEEWTDVRVKPVAYGQRTEIAFAWRADFNKAFKIYLPGGFKGDIYFSVDVNKGYWRFYSTDGKDPANSDVKVFYPTLSANYLSAFHSVSVDRYSSSSYTFAKGLESFFVYLDKLENSHGKIYYSDGMITTAGYDAYINFPNKTNEGQTIIYKPESIEKIDHPAIKPIELEFELKDLNLVLPEWSEVKEGDTFEWEIIKNDVDNQVTNNTFNTTHHTVNNFDKTDYNSVINNYYTSYTEIIIEGELELGESGSGGSNGGVCKDCPIEVGEDAVINVGDGAVINIGSVDDGFFEKLVGVFVPDSFTFVEEQVKRLMKLINDKLPTSDLQDMFESIFVASEKNPLDDLKIEIPTLGLRFEFPDFDGDWVTILKRVVTAVVVLYTLIYIYRKVFGNNGVMER